MKQKKTGKRLLLNKNTVTRLNETNMNTAKGGTFWTQYATCTTCLTPPGGSFCLACPTGPGD